MGAPFVLENGIRGPRIVVTGTWSPAIASYMSREGIRELHLNHARGWRGNSLDFLASVPALTVFAILDFTIADVTPIHQLTALRTLEISTYCSTPICFHRFAQLEDCTFYWRAGSESLFDCVTLRRLFLHRYSGLSSKPFAQLLELEELSIANSALREIKHLAALQKLRAVGLYNLKSLTALHGLQALHELEALELNGCRSIDQIDEVAALTHLRRLQLNDDGRIASLAPLRSVTGLEAVLFYESTNIADGDLTPLASLSGLRHTSFRNRRHYTHRREDLPLSGGGEKVKGD